MSLAADAHMRGTQAVVDNVQDVDNNQEAYTCGKGWVSLGASCLDEQRSREVVAQA